MKTVLQYISYPKFTQALANLRKRTCDQDGDVFFGKTFAIFRPHG
jgi:hypothetical protein